MIERILSTISEFHTEPGKILILTFSRKAAEEIRERLKAASSGKIQDIFAGTFHSFCLELIKKNSPLYIEHYGMKRFPDIIDHEQEEIIISRLFMQNAECFMGLSYDAAMRIISTHKKMPRKTRRVLNNSGLVSSLENFKESYIKYKKENSLIDYSDMTGHAIGLLQEYSSLRMDVQSRFDFIFVDEFQDTSSEDFTLLSLIASKQTGLFMVGDDCQSIYRFRGARVEYMINVEKFFPGAVIHKLTINYRSNVEIVNLSNKFIRRNRFRTKKLIVSANGKGGEVRFHKAESSADEAGIIMQIINNNPGCPCAVIYRNNYQGERLFRQIPDKPENTEFLTMHSSKGLEFNTVIIAGVSDNIIPDGDSDIEDERRLFYVALTRAKKRLHIIYHCSQDGTLPQFIKECGHNAS